MISAMAPDPAAQDLDAWRSAANYKELCELGARFVEGDIGYFPGWLAADVDPETDALAADLAIFNRAGFLTLASQPGRAPSVGFGGHQFAQRAFVAGFVTPQLAPSFDTLLATELVVCSYPATEGGGCRIPVGLRGGDVTSWAGHAAGPDELEIFAEVLAPRTLSELRGCRYLSVVDPAWQERDLLWRALATALSESTNGDRPSP